MTDLVLMKLAEDPPDVQANMTEPAHFQDPDSIRNRIFTGNGS